MTHRAVFFHAFGILILIVLVRQGVSRDTDQAADAGAIGQQRLWEQSG